LPALVAMDAFIISHTMSETELPEQSAVDRFLPPLSLPHRLRHEHPVTMGGLVWPHEGTSHRLELDEAMARVPAVLEECRGEFEDLFGRDPGGAIEAFETEDAERILVASGSITSTAREVVRQHRQAGEKVGLIKIKLFRPFPEDEIRSACRSTAKIGVLDRNYAAGLGGVFWQDLRAAFQGHRDDLLIQDYLTGLCGGDVTPHEIDGVHADLALRVSAEKPVWMGIETGKETQ
jgi:pyruvate/2-oxoacid:ferredoxin oxidoreductase alpha subunit